MLCGVVIPLYTDIEQLPADLHIACVVVRSAVVGGNGGETVAQLLQVGGSRLDSQVARHQLEDLHWPLQQVFGMAEELIC